MWHGGDSFGKMHYRVADPRVEQLNIGAEIDALDTCLRQKKLVRFTRVLGGVIRVGNDKDHLPPTAQ